MERSSLGLRAVQNLEQRQLAQTVQAAELLRLNVADLERWLESQGADNPALRIRPRGQDQRSTSRGAAPAPMDFAAPAEASGLRDWLDELAWLELEEHAEAWARHVLEHLEPGGYLALQSQELLERGLSLGLEGELADVEQAVQVVRELGSGGLGAADAIEALCSQLDPDDPDGEWILRLLRECLEDLAAGREEVVAAAMGLTLEEVQRLVDRLRTLELPAPVEGRAAHAIRPEVVVRMLPGGAFEVAQTRGEAPTVTLDPEVVALAEDPAVGGDERKRLRNAVREARHLIEGLEFRGRTQLAVATAAISHQKAFLTQGRGALRPLALGVVADDLQLHLSTVSRAVAGTWVETPHGVLPLRELFPAEAGVGGSTRLGVEELILGWVRREDKQEPLSDESLVEKLAQRGIQLSRRRVASLRRELGIPSSYRRRASS